MAEIVNLRIARKRKARVEQEREAAGNRALHGRSRAEKTGTRNERERSERSLDGHRLDRSDAAGTDE